MLAIYNLKKLDCQSIGTNLGFAKGFKLDELNARATLAKLRRLAEQSTLAPRAQATAQAEFQQAIAKLRSEEV